RRELGISEEAFMILSVGELNKNKNHEVIIRAIARLKKKDIHYVICGKGILDKYLRELSNELEIEDQVHILGFRDDVPDLCNIADIFAFTSYREGLGLSALEAMACRLPIITSNIHGIVDYSTNELTGYNYKPNDIEGFSEAIVKLYEDDKLRKEFGENSFEVAKNFSLEIVLEDLLRLYGSYRLAD
ncbi:MAG: glycosyltransferase, partial [Tissierellia bacterium]|nr:glycosyltransferase [Tissierellia bacterium]